MTIPATLDGSSRYTFDNADAQGPRMLQLQAEILDHHSTGVLTRAGVGPGWQCLDVGPGAGTITTWLARRVGPAGHVTALDLDPRHLQSAANVTNRQGDVRTAALRSGFYDLIHTRNVLLHLAERDLVLQRLIGALKPGGVLVVSDWDATRDDWLLHAPSRTAAEAFKAFQTGLLQILTDNGADTGWAWRAPVAVRSAGQVGIETTVYNRLWSGGEPGCLLHHSNSLQLQEPLLARGVTAAQLGTLREAMQDPDTLAYCYQMFTTVSRRPEN